MCVWLPCWLVHRVVRHERKEQQHPRAGPTPDALLCVCEQAHPAVPVLRLHEIAPASSANTQEPPSAFSLAPAPTGPTSVSSRRKPLTSDTESCSSGDESDFHDATPFAAPAPAKKPTLIPGLALGKLPQANVQVRPCSLCVAGWLGTGGRRKRMCDTLPA